MDYLLSRRVNRISLSSVWQTLFIWYFKDIHAWQYRLYGTAWRVPKNGSAWYVRSLPIPNKKFSLESCCPCCVHRLQLSHYCHLCSVTMSLSPPLLVENKMGIMMVHVEIVYCRLGKQFLGSCIFTDIRVYDRLAEVQKKLQLLLLLTNRDI